MVILTEDYNIELLKIAPYNWPLADRDIDAAGPVYCRWLMKCKFKPSFGLTWLGR